MTPTAMLTSAQRKQTVTIVASSPSPHSTQRRNAVLYQYIGLMWMSRCMMPERVSGS